MSQAVEIYSFADVDRSGKIRWTAAEIGLDIEESRLELGQHHSEEYLAMNPYAQVPTARCADDVMIESTAICIILAERHPTAGLMPAPGPQREQFWQAVAVATTSLEIPVVNYYVSTRGLIDAAWADKRATPMLILEKGMSRSVGWWSPGARERAGTEMETNAPRTTRGSRRHALA